MNAKKITAGLFTMAPAAATIARHAEAVDFEAPETRGGATAFQPEAYNRTDAAVESNTGSVSEDTDYERL